MKLLRKSGASRMAPVLIAAFGLAASTLYAATNVTIGLSGKTFGHGQSVSVKSAGKLDPSKVYTYTLEGTLKGSGKFAPITGKSLADLVSAINPTDTSPLTGRKYNTSGALPVASLSKKTYSGRVTLLGLDVSLTITSKITSEGQVIINIKDVSIKDLAGNVVEDKITFTSGSLLVTIAPTFRTHQEIKYVDENIGIAEIKVERWGYVGAATSVKVETSDGTAFDGKDYVGKSVRVYFAEDQTSAIVPIKIKNNIIKDRTREFKVTLSAPAKGSALEDRVQTLVRIENED